MHSFRAGVGEGVLSGHADAGEARGLVRNHVVITGTVQTEVAELGGVVAPAGAHRHVVVQVEGTQTRGERTHTAESERTEVTLNVQLSFTIKELAVGAESARVTGEAVFENEAHLVAVAEVFRALQAEAGTGVLARFFRNLVGRDGTVIEVLIVEAEVDLTVEGNVSSHSRTGKRAENGDSSESLFHLRILQKEIRVPPASPVVYTTTGGDAF